MKKKSFPILVVILMAFAMIPMMSGVVFADGDAIYTVTVNPGEGTGSSFTVDSTTILSQSDVVAGNFDGAKGCFFRYDGEDAIWYYIPTKCYFAPPKDKSFDGWLCSSGESFTARTIIPIAEYGSFTLTALWKGSEPPPPVYLSLPGSVDINFGDMQTQFDFTVNKTSYDEIPASANIKLFDSSFTCTEHDGTIPFTVTVKRDGRKLREGGGWYFRVPPDNRPRFMFTGYINIASDAWAAAEPGTYTATLDGGIFWEPRQSLMAKGATLTLVVPDAVTTRNVKAPTGKTFTYNGKSRTGVASGADYTLSGTVRATKAGNYTAKATLKNYTYRWPDGTAATKTIKWKINKATNTFKIKARAATVKRCAVKKKDQVLGVTKVITFTSKGQGAKTYIKKSGNKKITIAKKTGRVTVKKGLKKGTYKVNVKVKAKGNANYKASPWKTVTFKIKVR